MRDGFYAELIHGYVPAEKRKRIRFQVETVSLFCRNVSTATVGTFLFLGGYVSTYADRRVLGMEQPSLWQNQARNEKGLRNIYKVLFFIFAQINIARCLTLIQIS